MTHQVQVRENVFSSFTPKATYVNIVSLYVGACIVASEPKPESPMRPKWNTAWSPNRTTMEDERGLILEGKGELVVGHKNERPADAEPKEDGQAGTWSLTTDDGGRGRKQG